MSTLTTYPDVVQGTDEWHTLRRGIITASEVGRLLTWQRPDPNRFTCPDCDADPDDSCHNLRTHSPIKTLHPGRLAAADKHEPDLVVATGDVAQGLIATKAAERITGWTEETPMTPDMWRGVEAEPVARDFYSGHHREAVEYGFMRRDGKGWTLGYSPDGLVGDDGLIEIKAPRQKNHLRTILADEVPDQYVPQCQAALLVSGRKWVDFISYVGGMPFYVKRVLPDPRWHKAIIAAAEAFEASVTALVADYNKRVEGLPVPERIDLEVVI